MSDEDLIDDLAEALQWALDEIDGNTVYKAEGQFENCLDRCDRVLLKVANRRGNL